MVLEYLNGEWINMSFRESGNDHCHSMLIHNCVYHRNDFIALTFQNFLTFIVQLWIVEANLLYYFSCWTIPKKSDGLGFGISTIYSTYSGDKMLLT